jgi:universal stress protein E
MRAITNIVSIIDPTSLEQPGLIKAQTLAKALGSRLHLLACETRFTRESRAALAMASGGDVPQSLEPEELLEDLAAPAREEGIDVYVHVISGEPLHAALLSWIQRERPHLVVKDTHYHSLIRRTLVTNTDWQLIRSCPVSLLLTKQALWPSVPTLVAAIDPNHPKDPGCLLDLEILGVTSYLGKCFGSQIHVAHAYFPPTMPFGVSSGLPTVALSLGLTHAERAACLERIRRFVRPYGVPNENLHVETGIASRVLSAVAVTTDANVLVMGAEARSAWRRLIVGPTAERVLETLPCDVLLVKHLERHQVFEDDSGTSVMPSL